MPDQFFYTAIFRPSTGEILTPFAEHFADEAEMLKRARQFEAHARSLGEDDPWMVYSGVEPVEAYLDRLTIQPKEDESPESFQTRQNALAAKGAARTVSVLTAPEVDDSQEARPLPAWAVAQAEVEKAERFLIDAKEAHIALQKRADNLAEEAYATGSQTDPEDVKALKRQRAVRAQAEADQAQARLYHAEGDYAAKAQTYAVLMDAERYKDQPKEGKK